MYLSVTFFLGGGQPTWPGVIVGAQCCATMETEVLLACTVNNTSRISAYCKQYTLQIPINLNSPVPDHLIPLLLNATLTKSMSFFLFIYLHIMYSVLQNTVTCCSQNMNPCQVKLKRTCFTFHSVCTTHVTLSCLIPLFDFASRNYFSTSYLLKSAGGLPGGSFSGPLGLG